MTFNKALVQATLIFGADTWVVTPRIWRTLGSFHHRVAYRLAGMWMRRYMTFRWVYPPLGAAMTAVGLAGINFSK